MAYPARSIEELSAKVRQAFRQYLPGTDATIAQNVLYVFGKVFALLLKEYDLRLGWLYRQLFASTADDEHLERRHAAEYGLSRAAATYALGTVAGTGTHGAVIPAGVTFLSAGISYTSTEPATIEGDGTVTIPVKAVTPGVRGNRIPGEKLALANPGLLPTLAPQVEVATLEGGADREATESLRARVLDRKRRPPQGGAESDYEQWARESANVTAAWARRLENGPGALGVWFLAARGATPTPAEVDALAASLEARRMIGVRDLRVYAPTAVALDVTVSISPDTVELRNLVALAIADVIRQRRRPGLPDDDFVFSKSWLSEAIADVVGEDSHVLTLPAGDVTYGLGEIPIPGDVSFV